MAFLAWTPADATVLIKKSLQQIVGAADVIVIGTVGDDAEATYGPRAERIFTYTSVNVEDVLKGAPDADRVTVKTVGGEIGAHTLEVPGSPALQAGDRVVMFLYSDTDKYMSNIVYWQGLFTVKDEMVVERNEPLPEFVSKIRTIMQSGE